MLSLSSKIGPPMLPHWSSHHLLPLWNLTSSQSLRLRSVLWNSSWNNFPHSAYAPTAVIQILSKSCLDGLEFLSVEFPVMTITAPCQQLSVVWRWVKPAGHWEDSDLIASSASSLDLQAGHQQPRQMPCAQAASPPHTFVPLLCCPLFWKIHCSWEVLQHSSRKGTCTSSVGLGLRASVLYWWQVLDLFLG